MNHEIKNMKFSGFGSWKQCSHCGATFWEKLWHIGGYKSKYEPPCRLDLSEEWKNNAEIVDN